MTISDLLSTEVGITTAFALTWGVAIWGYRKNKIQGHRFIYS